MIDQITQGYDDDDNIQNVPNLDSVPTDNAIKSQTPNKPVSGEYGL
jgi:hypothetical protein